MRPNYWERSKSGPVIVAATLVGITISWLGVESLAYGVTILLTLAWSYLALSRPIALVVIGLLVLLVYPGYVLPSHGDVLSSAVMKLLEYSCFLPIALRRGIFRSRLLPVAAYAFVSITSLVLGTRMPGLIASQMAQSLATLALPWFVFSIRWQEDDERKLLFAIALAPIVSIVIGVFLFPRPSPAVVFGSVLYPRLHGLTQTAMLAALCLAGAVAGVLIHGRLGRRIGLVLAALNFGALVLTGERGAPIALTVMMAPWLYRILRQWLKSPSAVDVIRVLAFITALGCITALAVSKYIARSKSAVIYVQGVGMVHTATSGRGILWALAEHFASVNWLFGRGMGASSLIGLDSGLGQSYASGLQDEYVRLLLEVGVFGAVVVALAMVLTVVPALPSVHRAQRTDAIAFSLGLAIYAVTDNVLSGYMYSIPFFTLLGVFCSRDQLTEHKPPPPVRACFAP